MSDIRPKLTIGYSTLAQRVGNIVLPTLYSNVEILILIQNPDGVEVAPLSKRSDIRIIQVPGRGVAKSRNAAIREARGEYLIFADDDIVFIDEGLQQLIEHCTKESCDLVMGQAVDEHGVLRKRYPEHNEKLTKYNSARAATYEMLICVDSVRHRGVWFDENFGAGVTNYLGDEYIFIVDLLAAGGTADFIPVTVATHPVISSGSGWGTERDLRARSRVFTRVFGWKAPLVRSAFIVRHLGEVRNPLAILQFVIGRYSNKDG